MNINEDYHRDLPEAWPPLDPVELPLQLPVDLRPYTLDRTFNGTVLLTTALAMGRHTGVGEHWDHEEVMAGAGLSLLAYWDGIEQDWPTELPEIRVQAQVWCALPFLGGLIAARAVAETYRDMADDPDGPDEVLDCLFTGLIEQIWPEQDRIAEPNMNAIRAAGELRRYLRRYRVPEAHRGVKHLLQVGERGTWQERQVALYHLMHAAQRAAGNDTHRPALARALAQVLGLRTAPVTA